VYDVSTYDQIAMLRLTFVPGCLCFTSPRSAPQQRLAVSELERLSVWLFDAAGGGNEAVAQLDTLHGAPVTCMAANYVTKTARRG